MRYTAPKLKFFRIGIKIYFLKLIESLGVIC
ncbi:hypothetical protein SAMN05444395_102384 [Flavobacterium fryxellicola]|nr:hypothetical protein SAMN05444395_102384 [Flavobacterium fryxellicola]